MATTALESGPEAEAEIIERDGILAGPIRRPVNSAKHASGSIHDDKVAQKLGFKGGTIAGSIHMEQFPPLLLRGFGQQWFETGGLSCYFRHATTEGEPVQCFLRPLDPVSDGVQAEAWMDHEDGARILDATAWLGKVEGETLLGARLATIRRGGDIRILEHLTEGQEGEPVPTRIDEEAVNRRLEIMTEPLDWYRGASPWGGAVLSPTLMVQIIRKAEEGLWQRLNKAVGLFGAIEIEHLKGPVLAGHDYEARAQVLAIGETPRSEFFWYESRLSEPKGGEEVARMLMMLRFMKASSDLWAA